MKKRPFSKKNPVAQTLKAAFEYYIKFESGRWFWNGPLSVRGGYGVFTARPFGFVGARANRVAWQLYRGEIPKGMHVLITAIIQGALIRIIYF